MLLWSSKYKQLWPGYQVKDRCGSESRLQTPSIHLLSLGGHRQWQPDKMQLSSCLFFSFLGLWTAQAAVWSMLGKKGGWQLLLGIWAAASAAVLQPAPGRWEGQAWNPSSSTGGTGPPVRGTGLLWFERTRLAENWELNQVLVTKVSTFLMADIFIWSPCSFLSLWLHLLMLVVDTARSR